MKKTLFAALVSLGVGPFVAPATNAAPTMPVTHLTAANSDQIVDVQYRRRHGARGGSRFTRRSFRSGPRYRGRVIRGGRHAGARYYRGHRGYRYYRPGYRRYGGWWFPPAAFLGGAILGGALSGAFAAPAAQGYSSAHYAWCENHYRSYRASDNSFQPYHGPRRACRSPYWP